MTTFTIHAEEVTANALRKAAAEADLSINKYILRVLNQSLGISKSKAARPRFLDIPGTISQSDFERMTNAQSAFEKIDEEMWK